ncbi:hypothetical protein HK101_009044 [Irineochytrium annulatum]|nr:hypothetical protein HK101_009044 [Irineochytrium annulatum]
MAIELLPEEVQATGNEDFKEAGKKFRELKESGKCSNDELITGYAYFKQGSVGDCHEPKPGMLDIAGKMKHAAWTKLVGMSKEDAQKRAIEHVQALAAKLA